MEVVNHEVDKAYDAYTVKLDAGRLVYLTVPRLSDKLRVHSGSATGDLIATSRDQREAIDEAGTWLLEEIRQGRVVRG